MIGGKWKACEFRNNVQCIAKHCKEEIKKIHNYKILYYHIFESSQLNRYNYEIPRRRKSSTRMGTMWGKWKGRIFYGVRWHKNCGLKWEEWEKKWPESEVKRRSRESGIYEGSTKGMWNLKWRIWRRRNLFLSFFLSNPQPATLPVSSTRAPNNTTTFSLLLFLGKSPL